MPAPDRSYPVFEGQQRVRMLGDVNDRKIVLYEGGGQAAESDRDQQRLRDRRRTRDGDPARPPLMRAGQRQRALDERDDERDDQREVSELGTM